MGCTINSSDFKVSSLVKKLFNISKHIVREGKEPPLVVKKYLEEKYGDKIEKNKQLWKELSKDDESLDTVFNKEKK
jgi:hypothetical protein